MLFWKNFSLGSKKALQVSVFFVFVSVSWLLLSDSILAFCSIDIQQLAVWQTVKGILYLLMVTCFLFFLLRRSFNKIHRAQERIKKSEARFAAFMEHLPAYVFIRDNQHRFLFVNRIFENEFGVPAEQWIGKTIQEVLPDFHDSQILENDLIALEKGFDQKKVAVGIKGRMRIFMSSKFPLVLGKETAVGGISLDITELEQAIRDRQEAQADLSITYRAVEASSNGIMICDTANPRLNITYVNPAYERITGYPAAEVLGKNPSFLAGNDRVQSGLIEVKNALKEKREANAELRNYRKDGSLFWNELRIAPVHNAAGEVTHFVGVITDITERKLYEKELEHKVTHDVLTGLPNRLLLADRLGQSVSYAARLGKMVAVLFFDLDRFKRINDTWGHNTGDLVLREMARRLSASVRGCDTVARFGGDEFIVVLGQIAEANDIGPVTQKILHNLTRPLKVNEYELDVGASIGISVFPQDGREAETLIQKADLAMYEAKQSGGSTFRYFIPEMTTKAQEILAVEAGLREALRQKEFVLYYQPKVDIRSRRIVGAEALVRWQHPEKGLLFPGYFIPVAEESGLILPLGQWGLEEACRQAREWEKEGLSCGQISVNVSARQFRQEGFVEQVRTVFEETGAETRLISLEITESMVLEDVAGAVKTIAQLKELGLSLQLDDFGTGFSNFNSLRQFQVEYLKIDCAFVRDALQEPSAAAIVQSIIAIAHNLGMKAVAEGVETRGQLEYLARKGCDEYQGFLFSKAIPAEEFAKLLDRH